jgi:hypothetical protein
VQLNILTSLLLFIYPVEREWKNFRKEFESYPASLDFVEDAQQEAQLIPAKGDS